MQVAAASNAHSASQLRETFDQFVGETFYGQMIASLRKTNTKAAYFHGGRAEEIFQSQFDQTIATRLSDSNAHSFTGPMFKQFLSQTTPGGESTGIASEPAIPTASESPPWEGLVATGRR